jgi:nucleoside 2-deoxyribosyltransferase
MYYALPSRFGGADSNFIDTGTQVETGFIIAATIPITTDFGTENYDIWESENSGLAFVAVQVT